MTIIMNNPLVQHIIHWDTQLFLFLNGKHNAFFDFLMYWISHKYTWLPFYAFLLIFFIYKYRWRTFLILLFITILITLSDQLSGFMKNYFERLRPCHNPEISNLVHIVRGYCSGKFGFISSHAANSFAFATFLGILLKRNPTGLNRPGKFILPVLLIWASLISYSRIYLGVHYPADVIGGIILGIILGYIVIKLYLRFERKIFNPTGYE